MSAYEELVERCARSIWLDRYPDLAWESGKRSEIIKEDFRGHAREVLAEVFRTLETVTPEMWDALPPRALDFDEAYLAMLRASPLSPPKAKP